MSGPDWLDSGWCRVDDVLAPSEVATIALALDGLLALPAAARRAGDKPHAATRHLEELDERVPLIAELVERDQLLRCVGDLLGSDPVRTQTSLRSPNPGYGRQRLHADDVPKLADGAATVATAIVPLVDVDAGNGGTVVLPGSHLRLDLQRKSGTLESHPDEVALVGPAGCAFVFSGHLLHAGGLNRSEAPRPVLQILWRRR